MPICRKQGFTLVEVILSCAIISIFFLGSGAVLGSAARLYIQETASSGARGVIETAGDDIRNYIMSGKDIRPLFYMDGTRNQITVKGGRTIPVGKANLAGGAMTPFAKGTIFYADGSYRDADGTSGIMHMTEADKKALAEVAEGVDLGYKMIYVSDNGKYIQGLPYARDYYRGMTMRLEISEEESLISNFHVTDPESDVVRQKKQKLYQIRLTGTGRNEIFTVSLNSAVIAMNDGEFD